MSLAGKTALVTGGARRVGRAIVEELAAAGCSHRRPSSRLDRRRRRARRVAAAAPLAVKADLRERGAAAKVIHAALAATGAVDILVNSAAGYARTPLVAMDDDVWDDMLALNLGAPMRMMREAARAGVGSIVNIVDVAAWQPWGNWSAYATSKAALLHLSRCLALELAPRTRVNCVAPGTVIFPDDWDEARRAAQLAKVPLGREGSPADVARAVRYVVRGAVSDRRLHPRRRRRRPAIRSSDGEVATMGRVEELSFPELVQELAQYEHDTGPPDLEKSLRRRSVDARLMRLLSSDVPGDERRASVRVPGDLPVTLYVGEKTLKGTLVDLGEGGMRVHLVADGFDGDAVDVELDSPDPQHARATAKVQWKKAQEGGVDIGLHFATQAEPHRRRMRRLILEILRRMPPPEG